MKNFRILRETPKHTTNEMIYSTRVASEGVESPWFVLNEQRADRLMKSRMVRKSSPSTTNAPTQKVESSVPKITRLDDVTLTSLYASVAPRTLVKPGISYIDADRVRRRLRGYLTTVEPLHILFVTSCGKRIPSERHDTLSSYDSFASSFSSRKPAHVDLMSYIFRTRYG